MPRHFFEGSRTSKLKTAAQNRFITNRFAFLDFLGLQTGGDDRTERRGRERSRESRVFRRSLPTAREEAAPGEGTGAENARELPAPPEGTARTIGTLRAESRNPKVSRDPAPTRLGGVDRTA